MVIEDYTSVYFEGIRKRANQRVKTAALTAEQIPLMITGIRLMKGWNCKQIFINCIEIGTIAFIVVIYSLQLLSNAAGKKNTTVIEYTAADVSGGCAV